MTADLQLERRGEDWLLVITGELDRILAPELAPALESALATERLPVRVDLAAVTFLDAGGAAAVDAARRRCEEAGLSFVVDAHLPAIVRRVLALTGLDDLIDEEQPPRADGGPHRGRPRDWRDGERGSSRAWHTRHGNHTPFEAN